MNDNLLNLIATSLGEAIAEKDKPYFRNNQVRSSLFVSRFASNLQRNNLAPGYDLRVVAVDEFGNKTSGEWLLDITLTRTTIIEEKGNRTHAVIQIEWAIESEGNSALAEFARDFSKLAVVRARNYLYLHGFNHGTEYAAQEYFTRRVKLAIDILRDANAFPNSFYLAFWPSPERPAFAKTVNSIWDLLAPDINKKYKHLGQVYLYRLESSGSTFLGTACLQSGSS